jgi:signal transduction histidine kinase/CheY-like chemotaxis protein/predicted RNA-binding protein with RPS1 domain
MLNKDLMVQKSTNLVSIRVVKHLPLGLGVEAENGQQGIIRVRELSWNLDQTINWKRQYPIDWEGRALPLSSPKGQFHEFSLRLAEDDPWDELPSKINPGTLFAGVVTGVVAYGVFVEIAPGLTGLLHQSQLPHWAKASPMDLFWPGDKVNVFVKEIKYEERKIALGLAPLAQLPGAEPVTSMDIDHYSVVTDTASELDGFFQADAPKRHLLLVEDNPEQSNTISSWLRHLGQRVDIVDSAENALNFLEKSQPDIALIDIVLPKMDDTKLAELVLEKWPQVRVIITTDWARAEETMDILDKLQTCGAELLIKPLLPEDLISVLKKAATREVLIDEREDDHSAGVTFTNVPNVEPHHPLLSILQQYRHYLKFEQIVLFALDPVHRSVSILECVGDSILNKSAIPSLIYSPVRDVAEDHKTIDLGEIRPRDKDRFRYILELYPNLTACIGIPVPVRIQTDYALFAFDKHPHQIIREQKIYAEAMALAVGTFLEQDYFKQRSMLIQRTALIGHFTRGMVHEINNLVGPLASRLDNLQVILKQFEKNLGQTELFESRGRFLVGELAEIQNNVRKIINTTRMFGRITAKGRNEILRMDEIIEETIHFMRDTSDQLHVAIKFTPPQHLLVIKNQAAALEQVLLNVMLNAVQQIAELRPDSGGWIQVRVDLPNDKKGNSIFCILIEDNGPGIHTSLWEKIFEAGYTTRQDGSGIGLYISRNLMEEVGGKIYVKESFILGGTTFVLEIPHHF